MEGIPSLSNEDSRQANEQNEFSEEEKQQMLQIWAKLKAKKESKRPNQEIIETVSPILSPTYIQQEAYMMPQPNSPLSHESFKDDQPQFLSTTSQTVNHGKHQMSYHHQNFTPQQMEFRTNQNFHNQRQEWADKQRIEFLNTDNVKLFLENRRLLNENIQLKEQNQQYQKDLRITRSELTKVRQQLARLKSNSVSVDAFKTQMNKMASLLQAERQQKSPGKPMSPRNPSIQRQKSPPQTRRSPMSPRPSAFPGMPMQNPIHVQHHIPMQTQLHPQSIGSNQIPMYYQQIPQRVIQKSPPNMLAQQIQRPSAFQIVDPNQFQRIQVATQKINNNIIPQTIITGTHAQPESIQTPRQVLVSSQAQAPYNQTPIARVIESERKSFPTETTKPSPLTEEDQFINRLQNQLKNLRNINTHLNEQQSKKQTDKERQLRNAKLIYETENSILKKQLADREAKLGRLMFDLSKQPSRNN